MPTGGQIMEVGTQKSPWATLTDAIPAAPGNAAGDSQKDTATHATKSYLLRKQLIGKLKRTDKPKNSPKFKLHNGGGLAYILGRGDMVQ